MVCKKKKKGKTKQNKTKYENTNINDHFMKSVRDTEPYKYSDEINIYTNPI